MASSSIPSINTTITDADEYVSAQEEVESAAGVQKEAEDRDENEDEENDEDETDITELTVFIPQLPLPQFSLLPPQTAFVKHIKSRRRAQLMEQEKNQTFKILCGIVVLFLLFMIGALMVILAILFNIEDLFIIGGIFIFGGIVFTTGFIIVRCTMVLPYDTKDKDDFTALQSPERKDAPTPTFEL